MAYFEHIVHHQRGQLWYAYLYKQNKCWKKSNAPSGIRTHNTPISWKVLWPLSYRGNHSGVSRILATKEHRLPSIWHFWGLCNVDPPFLPTWNKSNWHKLKKTLNTVWKNSLLRGRVGGLWCRRKVSVSCRILAIIWLPIKLAWQYVVSVCNAKPDRTITS